MLGLGLQINKNLGGAGGRPPFYSDLTFYSKERIDEFVKNKLDETGNSDAYLTVDPTIDIIDLNKYDYTVVDGWNTVTFKTIDGVETYRVIGTAGTVDNIKGLDSIVDVLSLDSNYILDEDINLDVAPYNTGAGWATIDLFSGVFNGNGHKITGLYIDNSVNTYCGFFGRLSGIVSNIDFIEAGIISDSGDIGIICANQIGINSIIQNCSACGSITGNNNNRGGIVGYANPGNIYNCYSVVTITGTAAYTGGLCGLHRAGGTIKYCYSRGNVLAVIGRNISSFVVESYYDGEVGVNLKDLTFFDNKNWDFDRIWNIDASETINNGYPYLRNLNGEYVSPFGTLTKIVVTTITVDENKYVVFPDDILINVGTEEVPLFDRSNSALYTSDANENSIDWLGLGYEYYWRIDKLNTANILSWMQPDYKFSWFVKNAFAEETFDPITIKEIMAYNAPITGADNLSKIMKYLNLPEVV